MYIRTENYIEINRMMREDAIGDWLKINLYGHYVFKVNNKERFFLHAIKHGIQFRDVTKAVQHCIDNNISYYDNDYISSTPHIHHVSIDKELG